MYDPYDAFATTEPDHDDEQDHGRVDEFDGELEDSDVIDDVSCEAITAAGYAPAAYTATEEARRPVPPKQRALELWQRHKTRWIALTIALTVILAGGGTWSILDTRAKEQAAAAAALSAAKAAHATALRNADALAVTADEIAAAAEPFGLETERTTLAEATQTFRDKVDTHRKPGTVTEDIRTHTSKIYPLATPVREALDGVLAGVDAATTAKLDGATFVTDGDKEPTMLALTATYSAFANLTDAPAALTALAAAHTELQSKQDAARAAADAEAARIAAEEAAAAAAAGQAAHGQGGNTGGSSGSGSSARPGTGNTGRPGTGGGARPGNGGGGGANPGTGGGGGAAPGTGGGNPGGGGGTGPAPYSSADAIAAVRAAHGGSAALSDCDVINSGSFTPGSMIAPARHLIAPGGSLGWKAWAEGGRGHVVFYACY